MNRAALVVLLGACRLAYTGGARPVEPSALDSSLRRAAPTPRVRHVHRTHSGLGALAMVAGAWGQAWSVTELARAVPPNADGVRLGALRDYARGHGLDAFAIKATAADLTHELRARRPVLLGLMLPYDYHHNASHYEVAIAVNPHTGAIVSIDPATGGELERSGPVLDAEWKAAGYAALVVVGAHAASSGPAVALAPSNH